MTCSLSHSENCAWPPKKTNTCCDWLSGSVLHVIPLALECSLVRVTLRVEWYDFTPRPEEPKYFLISRGHMNHRNLHHCADYRVNIGDVCGVKKQVLTHGGTYRFLVMDISCECVRVCGWMNQLVCF